MKSVFLFRLKSFFILEIFRFLYVFPSFPPFLDTKEQMEVE